MDGRLRANKRRRGAYAICISLPQDAAEEVFAERGAR